ncbi:unnamed protein product, partial [marine sediment metagenome]
PSFINSEENVTLTLAKFLDKNNWEIVACHPPGGHTSFSILDGRRSKGGYMPDIVAIQQDKNKNAVPIVVIAECKDTYNKSDKDIKKLKNLSETHAEWIGFRLQNHLNRSLWIKEWKSKLQKVIGVGNINNIGIIQKDLIENPNLIIVNAGKVPIQIFIGKNAPAKNLFSNS